MVVWGGPCSLKGMDTGGQLVVVVTAVVGAILENSAWAQSVSLVIHAQGHTLGVCWTGHQEQQTQEPPQETIHPKAKIKQTWSWVEQNLKVPLSGVKEVVKAVIKTLSARWKHISESQKRTS